MTDNTENQPEDGPCRSTPELLLDDRELFRALSRASFEALFLSEKGICIGQNQRAEEIFGYTSAEALGRPGTDWIAPEARATVKANMMAGYEQPYESLALRKDGTTFPCEIQGKMMRYRGRDIRVTALCDITERKRLRQQRLDLVRQVQHAQKLESLGVLAGGIAHDFNNLLMVILGNADLALDSLPDDADIRPLLGEIASATRHAADLTRQMLAYSGMGHFVIKPLDMSGMVSRVVRLLETSIPDPVELVVSLAVDLPVINADTALMQQVVTSLVTNAGEAIEEGQQGRITVCTGIEECRREQLSDCLGGEELQDGTYVYVEVADTGCGMDHETRERMFDPFFSTKFTGRGLGLAAALGIIRRHRGVVRIRSASGEGTSIRILFPVARHQVESESPATLAWPGSGTVLLVDDDRSVLSVGRSMLERCGFRVITAEDGAEAVDLFREHADEICFVILDLTMKRMGGEQTFRELRKVRPTVQVVISSGYAEKDVRKLFDGMGIVGFIQKPYQMVELREMLIRVTGPPEPSP